MVAWQSLESPADSERCWRPLDDLPRLGILAGGEFDEEASVERAGACLYGVVEIAHGLVCGSAAQRPLPFRQFDGEHEARPRSDPSLAVYLDEEVPAIGAEFKAVVPDAAAPGTTARVVERRFQIAAVPK